MNILITGGAGYIGSHVAKQLLENTDYNITIIDNLSTGKIETVHTLQEIKEFPFFKMDLHDFNEIEQFLLDNSFDTIIHLVASIKVEESVCDPLKYYTNNTMNTTNLIRCAINANVKRFIFSSTASVYGNVSDIDENGITENTPTNPINPYGMSKLMSEQILQDTAKIYPNFKFVIFRYFNVAGADMFYAGDKLLPRLGQRCVEATHLLKVASECAVGKRDKIYIYGDDFNTPDGTGVRDYIHVDDLASAHIEAIEYLKENESGIFNVGYGKGYSVKEVINVMQRVSSNNFPVEIIHRRAGDPATLIANNDKLKTRMKWKPQYDNLELLCRSAYKWEKKY